MAAKTVTRADLCEAVYQKVGLSRTESATLVEQVLKEITDCLERGETVKLSSFGSFVVRKKGQRVGCNPKTGKEVPISARGVMVFKRSACSFTSLAKARYLSLEFPRTACCKFETVSAVHTWASPRIRWA